MRRCGRTGLQSWCNATVSEPGRRFWPSSSHCCSRPDSNVGTPSPRRTLPAERMLTISLQALRQISSSSMPKRRHTAGSMKLSMESISPSRRRSKTTPHGRKWSSPACCM
jgi:hypothetical protein